MTFEPTRTAGLRALNAFVPHAGQAYADTRNSDHGPGDRSNVSMLSPYLRYRLINEAEVIEAVLAQHMRANAEKFIQEVLWRTYWKGWLELRPAAWSQYVADLTALEQNPGDWQSDYERALAGQTGIDCFDAWVSELATHGYLHNHARMWFASIWIFTLQLPWQLGAALFWRHLLDGDPASNTLSWRWVAGLQTVGKTYLAGADNIARYTNGRFNPIGLATRATALTETPMPAPRTLPLVAAPPPTGPVGLLLHEDDLSLETFAPGGSAIAAIAGLKQAQGRAEPVETFIDGALMDGLARCAASSGVDRPLPVLSSAEDVYNWAALHGLTTVVTGYAPVGFNATALTKIGEELAEAGVALIMLRRPWDTDHWPLARRGFFAFREACQI